MYFFSFASIHKYFPHWKVENFTNIFCSFYYQLFLSINVDLTSICLLKLCFFLCPLFHVCNNCNSMSSKHVRGMEEISDIIPAYIYCIGLHTWTESLSPSAVLLVPQPPAPCRVPVKKISLPNQYQELNKYSDVPTFLLEFSFYFLS